MYFCIYLDRKTRGHIGKAHSQALHLELYLLYLLPQKQRLN